MIDEKTKEGLKNLKTLEKKKMTIDELEAFISKWFTGWFYTSNDYGDDCTEILSDEDVESDNPNINGMNMWEVWFGPVEGDVWNMNGDTVVEIGDVDIWEPEENWKN